MIYILYILWKEVLFIANASLRKISCQNQTQIPDFSSPKVRVPTLLRLSTPGAPIHCDTSIFNYLPISYHIANILFCLILTLVKIFVGIGGSSRHGCLWSWKIKSLLEFNNRIIIRYISNNIIYIFYLMTLRISDFWNGI